MVKKSNKKRNLAFFALTLTLLLSISGCDREDANTSSNAIPSTSSTQFTTQTINTITTFQTTTKTTEDKATITKANADSNKIITQQQNNNQSEIVYVTDNGKKYHRENCRSLSKSKNKHAISLEESKKEGYSPCSICNPPV